MQFGLFNKMVISLQGWPNKYKLISTSEETSVNRIDLLALTLAGPTNLKPVPDPLAVRHLENRLYITQIPKQK